MTNLAYAILMQLIQYGGQVENHSGRPWENRFTRITDEKVYFKICFFKKCIRTLFAFIQGKVSATYFWPGSDVKFPEEEGRSPNYFFKYNKSTGFQERVDQVLKWMDLPEDQRPSFVTLYFEEPDSTGHKEGPNSFKVNRKLEAIIIFTEK